VDSKEKRGDSRETSKEKKGDSKEKYQ